MPWPHYAVMSDVVEISMGKFEFYVNPEKIYIFLWWTNKFFSDFLTLKIRVPLTNLTAHLPTTHIFLNTTASTNNQQSALNSITCSNSNSSSVAARSASVIPKIFIASSRWPLLSHWSLWYHLSKIYFGSRITIIAVPVGNFIKKRPSILSLYV